MKIALCLGMMLIAPPVAAAQLNNAADLQDAEAPSAIQDSGGFSHTIEDLPLMPGLTPVPEEDMLFITPRSGRIAASTAQGVVDIDDIYRFYRQTLPQLGWQKAGSRSFTRNGETLRIDAHAAGKLTTVRFSVQPQ